MSSPAATPNRYPYQNEPIWSRSERTIARRVFDAALKRELLEVMQEAKRKASQIKEPADVWKLERFLTQRRKDIDRKYEFRSSRLIQVLGMLLSKNRITEEELRRLPDDKVKAIRSCAAVLSQDAA